MRYYLNLNEKRIPKRYRFVFIENLESFKRVLDITRKIMTEYEYLKTLPIDYYANLIYESQYGCDYCSLYKYQTRLDCIKTYRPGRCVEMITNYLLHSGYGANDDTYLDVIKSKTVKQLAEWFDDIKAICNFCESGIDENHQCDGNCIQNCIMFLSSEHRN